MFALIILATGYRYAYTKEIKTIKWYGSECYIETHQKRYSFSRDSDIYTVSGKSDNLLGVDSHSEDKPIKFILGHGIKNNELITNKEIINILENKVFIKIKR